MHLLWRVPSRSFSKLGNIFLHASGRLPERWASASWFFRVPSLYLCTMVTVSLLAKMRRAWKHKKMLFIFFLICCCIALLFCSHFPSYLESEDLGIGRKQVSPKEFLYCVVLRSSSLWQKDTDFLGQHHVPQWCAKKFWVNTYFVYKWKHSKQSALGFLAPTVMPLVFFRGNSQNGEN